MTYPEGRAALFVAVVVVVFGSVALGAAAWAVLHAGESSWFSPEAPTGWAAASPEEPARILPAAAPPTSTSIIRAATPAPTVATAALTAASGLAEYVVVAGDVLERIARQFSVTPSAVAEANGLAPPYRLELGQVLLIPTDRSD